MSSHPVVLVFGASHAVGHYLLERTADQGVQLIAISRRAPEKSWPHVTWMQHDLAHGPVDAAAATLVSLGPIGWVPAQIEAMPGLGRVIALSSASPVFKRHSPDPAERDFMRSIEADEQRVAELCDQRDIVLTLLRTTMIYGGAGDENVSRIAHLARRLPVVPVTGQGRRQPVHADDIARLVCHCLAIARVSAGSWLIGGSETLSYPDMVRRIASANGRTAHVIRLPAWAMKAALGLARLGGLLGDVSPVMIDRQKVDLVVDDQPAREHLGWDPRPFRP